MVVDTMGRRRLLVGFLIRGAAKKNGRHLPELGHGAPWGGVARMRQTEGGINGVPATFKILSRTLNGAAKTLEEALVPGFDD